MVIDPWPAWAAFFAKAYYFEFLTIELPAKL